MSAIFAWLLQQAVPFLIDLAVKYGLPAAAAWIVQKWPKIPQALVDTIVKIITDAVAAIEGHNANPALMPMERLVLVKQEHEDARTKARDSVVAHVADVVK